MRRGKKNPVKKGFLGEMGLHISIYRTAHFYPTTVLCVTAGINTEDTGQRTEDSLDKHNTCG